MDYEILDHTADRALRAWGHDLRELIEHAAAGMMALLYVETPPAAVREVALTVTADGPEMVLHHSLRALLYLMEDEALAPVSVAVTEATDEGAALRVGVIPREAAEPLFGALIKAVTRHDLRVEPDGDQLTARIVFDV